MTLNDNNTHMIKWFEYSDSELLLLLLYRREIFINYETY